MSEDHPKHISQDGDGVEQRMLPVLPSFSIICSNHCSTFKKTLKSNVSCVFCESWLKQMFQMQARRGVQTAERGIQFSLNVELPRNQESRLLGMKDCIKMAKSCLNLSKATSSTQNADLLEFLLLAFEEKVQRSKETSCVSSLLANQLSSSAWTSSSSESPQSFPRPVATSTPRSRTSLAFDDPASESPQSSSQSASELSPTIF